MGRKEIIREIKKEKGGNQKMIKKFLSAFLTILIVLVIVGAAPEAFSENKVQYIEKSFENIRNEFFTKAEKIWEGGLVSHFICKNKNSESYYLIVNVDHLVPQYIISIHARKEIKLGNEAIEWYEEGIHLNQFVEKYRHKISHGIIYQIGNEFKEEELSPAKVWDSVIVELFGESSCCERVYGQTDNNDKIENNINYIKRSFDAFKKLFFANAEVSSEGILSCYSISINVDLNTTYYIIVYVEGYPIRTMTSIWVRKEVELGSGVVEMYNEGIYRGVLGFKDRYLIYHKMLYRNDNCRMEQLKPVKIWDKVISFWLEKINK